MRTLLPFLALVSLVTAQETPVTVNAGKYTELQQALDALLPHIVGLCRG